MYSITIPRCSLLENVAQPAVNLEKCQLNKNQNGNSGGGGG